MNLWKSFTYMFLDKKFPKTFAIGYLLLTLLFWSSSCYESKSKIAFCCYLITWVLINGYFCVAVKNCASKNQTLPDWVSNLKLICLYGIRGLGANLLICSVLISVLLALILLLHLKSIIHIYFMIFVLVVFCSFFINAVLINFVHTMSFFTYFHWKNIFKIVKTDLKLYFFLIFAYILGILLLSIYECLVALFIPEHYKDVITSISVSGVYFYLMLAYAHLLGQYYKKYLTFFQQEQDNKTNKPTKHANELM